MSYVVGPGWGLDFYSFVDPVINEENPNGKYDPREKWGFYVNDVSDRIGLGVCTWFETPESEISSNLLIMAEQSGSEPGTISNDADTYVNHTFDPAWTAVGADTEELLIDYPFVYPYGIGVCRVDGNFSMRPDSYLMAESDDESLYTISISRNNVENPKTNIMVAPMKNELVQLEDGLYMATNSGAWLQPFDGGEWMVYPKSTLAMNEGNIYTLSCVI